MTSSHFPPVAAALGALFLAGCATDPTVDADGEAVFVNPHPPGTYAHFTAEQDYPKTMNYWKHEALLARTGPSNSRIVVSLDKQRAYLMNGEEVVIDYPISSGKPSRPTPTGSYEILEKIVDKSSNAYGKVYDAEGNRIYGVETPADVPEDGKFVGSPMPYWMRLTWDGVGHHIGPLPSSRRPVSHACIRGPRSVVPTVFGKVKVGTPVIVQRQAPWSVPPADRQLALAEAP